MQWNWFSVVTGCTWVTCISDIREPISLHQAVCDTILAVQKFKAYKSLQMLEYKFFTCSKISAITAHSFWKHWALSRSSVAFCDFSLCTMTVSHCITFWRSKAKRGLKKKRIFQPLCSFLKHWMSNTTFHKILIRTSTARTKSLNGFGSSQ